MPPALHRSSFATCSRLLLIVLLAIAALPMHKASAAMIVYVKPGGLGTGTSWINAADLGPALTAAVSGTEIWVAKGTYRSGISSRADSFMLKNGVAVYGGF